VSALPVTRGAVDVFDHPGLFHGAARPAAGDAYRREDARTVGDAAPTRASCANRSTQRRRSSLLLGLRQRDRARGVFENGKHPENGWDTQKADPLAGLLSLH
jgi:hypothetical protein